MLESLYPSCEQKLKFRSSNFNVYFNSFLEIYSASSENVNNELC